MCCFGICFIRRRHQTLVRPFLGKLLQIWWMLSKRFIIFTFVWFLCYLSKISTGRTCFYDPFRLSKLFDVFLIAFCRTLACLKVNILLLSLFLGGSWPKRIWFPRLSAIVFAKDINLALWKASGSCSCETDNTLRFSSFLDDFYKANVS